MDELKKYYDYLRKNGADVPGSYESFRNTLQDEKAARQYYDYLQKNAFDTPDTYEKFASTFGLKTSGGGLTPLNVPAEQLKQFEQANAHYQDQSEAVDMNDPLKTMLTPIRKEYGKRYTNYLNAVRNTGGESSSQQYLSKVTKADIDQKKRETMQMDADAMVKNQVITEHLENKLVPDAQVGSNALREYAKANKINLTFDADGIAQLDTASVAALPRSNETIGTIVKRINEYGEIKKNIDFTHGDIKGAALMWYMDQNPHFEKQITKIQQDNPNGTIQEIVPPVLWGKIINSFLEQPNVKLVADKNEYTRKEYEHLKANLLTEIPEYGINEVANELSREREKRGRNNWLVNFAFGSSEYMDKLAEDMYKGDPIKLQIYNEHIKGNISKYIDTPGFLDKAERGIEHAFGGMKNSVLQTLNLKTEGETIYDALNKESSAIDSQPKGFLHQMSAVSGDFAGLIASMYTGGNFIKGIGLIKNPQIANKLMVGLTFYGDEREDAAKLYPGEVDKQLLRAGLSVAAFASASSLFPGKKLDSFVGKLKPEIDNVVKLLSEGKISIAAAKDQMANGFAKLFDFGKGVAQQNLKTVGEMTAITGFKQILDKVLALEGEVYNEAHPNTELIDVAKNTMMGAFPISVAHTVGERKMMKNVVFDVASKPDRYKRLLDEQEFTDADIAATINDRKQLIDKLSTTKLSLDEIEMPERMQKSYLLQTANEQALQKKIAQTPDPLIRKQYEDELAATMKKKESLLNYERVEEDVEAEKEPVEEKPVAEPVAGQDIKSFTDRIAAGEKIESPEDLQFYENNKDAIEAELKSRSEQEKITEVGPEEISKPIEEIKTTTPTEEIIKPVEDVKEPAPTEIKEEKAKAAEALDEKIEELAENKKATAAKMKAQKKDIVSQMTEIENILWGDTSAEDRKRFEESNEADEIFKSNLGKLKRAGFDVDDNMITIEVKDDGIFRFTYEMTPYLLEKVKKEFPGGPAGIPSINMRSGGGTPKYRDIAVSRGSRERNRQALEIAKENFATAKKSGNKKLQDVFQKEVEKEQKVYEVSEDVDWAMEADKKEFAGSKEVEGWQREYQKGRQDYQRLDWRDISLDDYREAKEKGLTGKDYSYDEVMLKLQDKSSYSDLKDLYEQQKADAEKRLDEFLASKKSIKTQRDRNTYQGLQNSVKNIQGNIEAVNRLIKKQNETANTKATGKNKQGKQPPAQTEPATGAATEVSQAANTAEQATPVKISNRLREAAQKVRESNFGKIKGDGNVSKLGPSFDLNEAVARTLEIIADAIDAGERFADAVKRAVKDTMAMPESDKINEKDLADAVNLNIKELTGINPDPKPQSGTALELSKKKFTGALSPKEQPKPTFFSRVGNMFKNISAYIDNPNRRITKLQHDIENYYKVKTGKVPLGRVFEQNVQGVGLLKVQDFVTNVLGGLSRKSMDDLQQYIFAKRIIDRGTHDIQNKISGADVANRETGNITMQDAVNILADMEGSLGKKKIDQLEKRAQYMQDVMKQSMERLVESGVLSKEAYDNIKKQNDFYAPFNVVQELVRQNDGDKRSAVASNIVRKIKGITFKEGDFEIGDLQKAQDAFKDGTITKEEFYDTSTTILDNLHAAGKISDAQFINETAKLGDSGFAVTNIFDKTASIIYDSIRIAHKNDLMNRLDRLKSFDKENLFTQDVDGFELRYDKDGTAYQVPKRVEDIKTEDGFGVVGYRKDGKQKFMAIDKKAADVINGLDRTELAAWMKGINAINTVFRTAVITLSPSFQYANFVIDFLRTAAMNKYGVFAGKNIGDAVANAVLFVPQYAEAILTAGVANFSGKKLGLYKTFMESKGYSSGMYDNPFKNNEQKLKMPAGNAMGAIKNGIRYLFSIPEKLGRTLEQSHKIVSTERGLDVEAGMRMGLARIKNILGKAKTPADMAAALDRAAYETQNFAGSPNFPATHSGMKVLSVFLQFFSARVKGEMTDYRRLTTMFGGSAEGVKISAKERAQMIGQFAAVSLVPKILFAMMNHETKEDEDEFNTMPPWDRNNYINIPYGSFELNGKQHRDYIKIPVRGIEATLNTMANDFISYAKREKPEVLKHAIEQVVANASPLNIEGDDSSEMFESAFGNLTPVLKWTVESALNRDTYRHQDLIPDNFGKNGMLARYKKGELQPYEVVTKKTPNWAVDLSKWLKQQMGIHITPITLDHMENTFVGNISEGFKGNTFTRRMLRSESNYPVYEPKK